MRFIHHHVHPFYGRQDCLVDAHQLVRRDQHFEPVLPNVRARSELEMTNNFTRGAVADVDDRVCFGEPFAEFSDPIRYRREGDYHKEWAHDLRRREGARSEAAAYVLQFAWLGCKYN